MNLLHGRLWQIEVNKTLGENVRMAAEFYDKKYEETFETVAMRPDDREKIKANRCFGVRVVSDKRIVPGCILFVMEE